MDTVKSILKYILLFVAFITFGVLDKSTFDKKSENQNLSDKIQYEVNFIEDKKMKFVKICDNSWTKKILLVQFKEQ